MTEETRSFVNLIELVNPPKRPYITPLPKDGLIYDYKFVKDGAGRYLLLPSVFIYAEFISY